MMRIVFVFLLLLLSAWLGVQLSRDPGYLMISIQHWTVETTLTVALIGLILFFFFLHFTLLLLGKVSHSPLLIQQWRNKRRIQKAQAKTRQGLIEFSEGYWAKAKNHLIKALPDADTPLLNYLTAARAAQEMGDHQLRDDYLREAQQAMPDAKIAVELTQAQLQLANQQWEQALATLKHLHHLAPHHPYVLKLLMRLYKEVKDWPQLIALLPELKRNQIVPSRDLAKLSLHAYLQALKELTRYGQAEAVTKFMANLPRSLANNPELIAEHCRFLLRGQQEDLAESILRRFLRHSYHEQLIALYGQIKSDAKQLIFAESLIKKHAHSAVLYLTLGKLSVAEHLWGKARHYFERSIDLRPSAEAYQELGLLMEQLNEAQSACHAYKQGLNLAIAD